ncbi:MAG: glycosyl hydrolase family 8 [Clostridium sp.]
MKRFYSFVVILLIVVTIGTIFSYQYIKPLRVVIKSSDYIETKMAKGIRNFIETKMARDDGAVYTNYLNKESNGDETLGHYILSESQGLIMEYALKTNNEELFHNAYSIVKKNMSLDNGLISWRISKDNQKNTTSALIDEIRIARCLIEAHISFNKFSYKVDAINISKAILSGSTYNGMVTDFNDGVNTSNILTLCYIDLEAFKLLGSIDDKWKDILNSSTYIIKKGYLGDATPLFKKSYNLKEKTYSKENENELLYSLMVWENLISQGVDPGPINNWIKDQLQTYGCLYTKYNIQNNKPTAYIESTSIYAIALRISLESGDKDLSDKLYKNLMKYYINKGELAGGFGMEKEKQAFSFDNIEAMISLLKKIEK